MMPEEYKISLIDHTYNRPIFQFWLRREHTIKESLHSFPKTCRKILENHLRLGQYGHSSIINIFTWHIFSNSKTHSGSFWQHTNIHCIRLILEFLQSKHMCIPSFNSFFHGLLKIRKRFSWIKIALWK